MKPIPSWLSWGAFAMSALLLTGCYIGPGGICGPQTPKIYCASEEERERVFNPPPYAAHWIKEGMTRESRRADSWACGAANTVYAADHVAYTEATMEAARLPHERNVIGAIGRLRDHWQACMAAKGYTRLDRCDARCLHP